MNNHFDAVRWAGLSLYDQLGNIASEVGRAMSALRRGDTISGQAAYFRGLDLIDATLKNLTAARTKELLRARELFSEAVENRQPDQALENYFMQFAIAARMQKGL